MSLWNAACSVHLCYSVRKRKALPEWKNTNHVNRKCQYILQAAPFSFRAKAEYATRGGPSTFKNMPFMPQEGRLLRARRAYSQRLNITRWFLVGYILGCRRWYMRVLRVVSLVGCKDFLSLCWLVSDREVVWEVTPTGPRTWGVGSFSSYAGETFLSQKTFLSLMVDIIFSDKTHRSYRTFWRTFRAHEGEGTAGEGGGANCY